MASTYQNIASIFFLFSVKASERLGRYYRIKNKYDSIEFRPFDVRINDIQNYIQTCQSNQFQNTTILHKETIIRDKESKGLIWYC